ncbi:hypothetical protein HYX14_03625 [Candidatus Woesearchaeota archaeon]|nr:hypothetical protein [Candidatus Woesearchaeota archaeon]
MNETQKEVEQLQNENETLKREIGRLKKKNPLLEMQEICLRMFQVTGVVRIT